MIDSQLLMGLIQIHECVQALTFGYETLQEKL
jgi:hypothetical protein